MNNNMEKWAVCAKYQVPKIMYTISYAFNNTLLIVIIV